MINLELKKRDFKGNEKWPLLYVIADIYFNCSSEDNPLLDNDLVRIAKSNYNLSIERHLIKKYRLLLSHYFGFEFSLLKKGYYISNDLKMINNGVKNNHYPSSVVNFDEFKIDDEMSLKVSIISTAIKRKRKIRFEIEYYVYFFSNYLMAKKHVEPLFCKPKTMIVSPLQIFIFSGKAYLLSFNDSENHFYINLLENVHITKESITRYKSSDNLSFDLKKYIEKQDFIVTGPIDESYSFKTNKYFESYGAEAIYITKMKNLNKPDMPSFLQSLIDLFGNDNISIKTPKILYFEKSTGQPKWDSNSIEIVISGDNRIESFLNRFREYREIGAERWNNHFD